MILGVKDELALKWWEEDLVARRILCEHFVEPDLGNETTALAVHPEVDGHLFRRLRLL